MEKKLRLIYRKLHDRFGPQYWWPGETPFEVMIGAILTQNTNWKNVERVIANLKREKLLSAAKMKALPLRKLAALIRPSGYYNIKARRLRSYLDFYFKEYAGKAGRMKAQDAGKLRAKLLRVKGIGPETADSIMLYALNKPVFVIDAYTKRILSRHGMLAENASYEEAQNLFRHNLKNDVELFNEFHALLVRVGKVYCLKSKPGCKLCPLGKAKKII